LDELQKLPEAAAQEMMALTQKMESVLRQVYSPEGINPGMNIGRAAGASREPCPHERFAALGGRYEFHDSRRREPGAAGVVGGYISEDQSSHGRKQNLGAFLEVNSR
jgi:hypothetical protein